MRKVTRAADARISMDEWGALDEDVPGELVDGTLVEEEVASFVHEFTVTWLSRVVGAWVDERGGWMFGSDAKYAVDATRGRKPDASIFLAGRRPPATGVCTVPPDIMIEVITPTPRDGRRDRIEKLREYAAFGVAYYWLIDPALRSLEILELCSDGRYSHALDVTRGCIDDIPGCPGLSLDLDRLWEQVDRLEQGETT